MLQRLNDGNASIIMPGIPPATSDRLPRPTPVCYKRYMRKWMSERLKRRKKPGDTPVKDGTKAPEPLQPRFYDDEPTAAREVPTTPVASTRRSPRVEQVQAPVLESPQASAPIGETSSLSGGTPAEASSEPPVRPRISRRRRSRGGRGGSRSKPAAMPSGVTDEAVAKGEAVAEAPEADLLPGESRSSRSRPAQSPRAQGRQPLVAPSPTQSAATSPVLPAQSAAVPRPSKGTVVLAIGFAGGGKRSLVERPRTHTP